MYKLTLINFGYSHEFKFDSHNEALEKAKSYGFEVRIEYTQDGVTIPLALVSPIYGVRPL
jgi:hypothetical protein